MTFPSEYSTLYEVGAPVSIECATNWFTLKPGDDFYLAEYPTIRFTKVSATHAAPPGTTCARIEWHSQWPINRVVTFDREPWEGRLLSAQQERALSTQTWWQWIYQGKGEPLHWYGFGVRIRLARGPRETTVETPDHRVLPTAYVGVLISVRFGVGHLSGRRVVVRGTKEVG